MASLWVLAVALFAVSTEARSSRIVGGSPTTIDQYPSIVQVERQDIFSLQWSQMCGGSILTRRTILSGAQCFAGDLYQPRLRRIRAGATFRNFGGVIVYIEHSFNHPTYGLNGNDGDICVVELTTPLEYNPVVQRTAIPPQNAVVPDNLPVRHAGWGATSEGGPPSEVLQDVLIYTVNNDLCRERYETLPSSAPVTRNMICAGLLDIGGRDACQGDAGGPLYYGNITIGVYSWGYKCGNATFPSISTAVGPYVDWIVAIAI